MEVYSRQFFCDFAFKTAGRAAVRRRWFGSGAEPHERNLDLRIAKAVPVDGNHTHDHGDFIAVVKPGTVNAILVNLVGQFLPAAQSESRGVRKNRACG